MHRRYSHLLAGIVLAAALGTAAAAAAELGAADCTVCVVRRWVRRMSRNTTVLLEDVL
jgi:hypothetical protein